MKIRVISATVAVLLLIAIYYFTGRYGLMALCCLAATLAILEFTKLGIRRLKPPRHLEHVFLLLSLGTFATIFWGNASQGLGVLSVSLAIFTAMTLLTVRASEELEGVLQLQALGAFGIFYCGILPGLIARVLILDSERGHLWLFNLMAIVFSGDTFAYLGGRAWGQQKLLPVVSPKKTIAGSLCGLVGSAAAGLIMGLTVLRDQPLGALICMALVTGAFAQIGDLVESLLKRVAEVKDSGSLMPGHGGVLDRLDGLLFAAPVYYVLISLLI